MDELLTGNIWDRIKPIADRCRRRIAALAYVSRSDLIPFEKGDLLVCDASNLAIKVGETSATALSELYDRGVILFSRPDLHAKVLVMGAYVLIGSANLSASSTKPFREASYLTSRATAVSQAKAFIQKVTGQATRIDKEFLERALRLEVNRPKKNARVHKQKKRYLGSRFWVVNVDEAEPHRYQKEEGDVRRAEQTIRKNFADPELEVEWIRSADNTRFQRDATAGDTMVQLWTSLENNRVTVFAPTAILLRQAKDNWVRFYIDDSESLNSISWTEFERRARQAGVTYLKRTSCREVRPNDISLIESILKTERR